MKENHNNNNNNNKINVCQLHSNSRKRYLEWTILIIRDTNSVPQSCTLDIFPFSSLTPKHFPNHFYFFILCNLQVLFFFNCHIRKEELWKGKPFLKKDRKSKDKECNSTRRARVG